jgi:hypothetical protein
MGGVPLDLNTVSHGIQLAVAPVFMLSAVAALIGALATHYRSRARSRRSD